MANKTEFAKEVEKKLIDLDKSRAWLAEEVTKKTHMYCSAGYLSKIFNGYRNPEKIIDAIKDILKIA